MGLYSCCQVAVRFQIVPHVLICSEEYHAHDFFPASFGLILDCKQGTTTSFLSQQNRGGLLDLLKGQTSRWENWWPYFPKRFPMMGWKLILLRKPICLGNTTFPALPLTSKDPEPEVFGMTGTPPQTHKEKHLKTGGMTGCLGGKELLPGSTPRNFSGPKNWWKTVRTPTISPVNSLCIQLSWWLMVMVY